jgi:predicted membrane chloride channel (bestrophin family)
MDISSRIIVIYHAHGYWMTQRPHHYWLHQLFVFTDVIGRIPAPILMLIVAALSVSAAQTWINTTHVVMVGYVAGIGLAVFIAGDWVMLA